MHIEHHPAVVVGSGLAGLTTALSLAPLATLVVSKTPEVFVDEALVEPARRAIEAMLAVKPR